MNAHSRIITDTDLLELLVEHDRYMLGLGFDGPDDRALGPKSAALWRRMREAVASYSSASVARNRNLCVACANVWAHLAGSDDPELIALANECHEALTRARWKMVPVQQQAQEMVG
jgi:hypothetical protein